jgi:geranylgeranyl diphosphate synthase type II
MMSESAFEAYLQDRRALVDASLDLLLPKTDHPPRTLSEAMRYSVFAGGKRIRPILCLAATDAVGGNLEEVMPVACALECIHTYSLIHVDLPAMDNDDLRRGRPTSHKVYGEDLAILAGDALLTEAFAILAGVGSRPGTHPERLLAVIASVARAAGVLGMVGGQVLDVQSEGKPVEAELLYSMHARKTGAMIEVSATAGALLSGAEAKDNDSLREYGRLIGLAFQVADDILNVSGDARRMGKNTGSDASRGKMTFPALLGLAGSRKKLAALLRPATAALNGFDAKADPLRSLAQYIMERQH